MFLIIACLSAIFSAIALPAMNKLAVMWRLERKNFKGKVIPAGFGFVIVLAACPVYLATLSWGGLRTALFIAAVLGFGVLGLLDDIFGNRDAGGFHGHFGLLKQGKMSTGLIKAVVGGLLSLVIGYLAGGGRIVPGFINGLVIALSANLLNLLDLRPGRAVSFFWVGVLASAILGGVSVLRDVLPVAIPAVPLTVLDRSARVMLGDAGSNPLGAVVGLALVYSLGVPAKAVFILVMILVHLYAERYSISKLIDSNRFLSCVDRLLGER